MTFFMWLFSDIKVKLGHKSTQLDVIYFLFLTYIIGSVSLPQFICGWKQYFLTPTLPKIKKLVTILAYCCTQIENVFDFIK